MKKDTSKLLEEIGITADFRSFYEENKSELQTKTLSVLLGELLEKKQIKKSEARRRSELSEIYAYQIFSGVRVPERKKLLSLAIGMGLELEETQGLLKCAGYSPLYVKLPFDSVIIYGIHKKLSVMEINELLYEYCEEILK